MWTEQHDRRVSGAARTSTAPRYRIVMNRLHHLYRGIHLFLCTAGLRRGRHASRTATHFASGGSTLCTTAATGRTRFRRTTTSLFRRTRFRLRSEPRWQAQVHHDIHHEHKRTADSVLSHPATHVDEHSTNQINLVPQHRQGTSCHHDCEAWWRV